MCGSLCGYSGQRVSRTTVACSSQAWARSLWNRSAGTPHVSYASCMIASTHPTRPNTPAVHRMLSCQPSHTHTHTHSVRTLPSSSQQQQQQQQLASIRDRVATTGSGFRSAKAFRTAILWRSVGLAGRAWPVLEGGGVYRHRGRQVATSTSSAMKQPSCARASDGAGSGTKRGVMGEIRAVT